MQLDVPPDVPVAGWMDPVEMARDPYPFYARLRAESPVAYVPFMGSYVVATYDECRYLETSPAVFASDSGGSNVGTMRRTMGDATMLDTDDPHHAEMRAPVNPVMRPKAMKERWSEAFAENTRFYLDRLAEAGPDGADLNTVVASPLATKNLMVVLGLRDVPVETVRVWSGTLMEGLGNVLDDSDTWARVDAVREDIDLVLREVIARVRAHPDDTFISALDSAGHPEGSILANVKLALSGGINEPQHAITSIIWSLSEHPDQRALALAEPERWPHVFDEVLRWLSPIHQIPRRARQDVELCGVRIPADSGVAGIVASANRDESIFENADTFDIRRSRKSNLAFGAGVHQCLGVWMARWAIGAIAVPMLFERFEGLSNANDREASWFGFIARGLVEHPVTWDRDRG